ncbi:PREDICTED: integrin alpha-M-like [Cyprinodon variegatus]|uniref:integrin alpha-M-like n=1 Tax=Cyprinodon variegatus TaxID=28743 RepID=UPI000742A788|nr:PREDICTED: integrin alpha-M-like [Cyprinodon variegatus]
MISIENITCLGQEKDDILPMVNVAACFVMEEATKTNAGPGINISLMLMVDPNRPIHRGFFQDNKKKSRNITHTLELTDKKTCFNYSIFMHRCVKDTLSPVQMKLNFSQSDSENAIGVLNMDSKRNATVDVPFVKHCDKEICIPDLKVDFRFTSDEVLVTENNGFSVLITLDNIGDDSYNTSLTLHYPPGLSFSKMEPTGVISNPAY